MVFNFFKSKDFNVITYDKIFSLNNILDFTNDLNTYDDSIIINCIGKIKQKSTDSYDLILSNSILPLELSRKLKSSHILIHPSTDCVFDGSASDKYMSFDKHTATDVYGISKSMGESAVFSRSNTLIIRVSIIGPDLNSEKGLLSWFLNIPNGAIVDGYINHLWNGITTLEWCEKLYSFIHSGILESLLSKKIIQLGTNETYTKFKMLNLFNDVFDKKILIKEKTTEFNINRCLYPEIISEPLPLQLFKLKNTNLLKLQ